MKMKTAVLLAMTLVLATNLQAAPGGRDFRHGFGAPAGHPPMERFGGDRLDRLAAFLELSEQQVGQWKEAHERQAEAMKAGSDERRDIHRQIRDLAAVDEPDAAAIGELVIEAQRQSAAAHSERETLHAELLSILTPEQQERFEALREMRPERSPRSHRGFRGRSPRRGARPGQG